MNRLKRIRFYCNKEKPVGKKLNPLGGKLNIESEKLVTQINFLKSEREVWTSEAQLDKAQT